ncbi:MAG: polyprenyl synthetase family protein [Alphaproteobacteria bacterium]
MAASLTKGRKRAAGSPSDSAFDRLKALLEDDLEQVNRIIVERMQSPVRMIPQLAGYLIGSGGKRLRPLLTLATARMMGYGGTHHQRLAATVEFIHTATLLHDDVVDESALRRGQAAANLVWGNQASVLVGDFLFSRAFQLMVEVEDLRILDVLAQASAVIAEGEVMQLASANDLSTTEDVYLQVITAKTAALFAAAAQVGGMVAGCSREQEEALEIYGRTLGIAFQLVDDALDYSGSETDLGKSVGDDFREGKITLPVVLACQKGNEKEQAFWKRTIEDGNQRPDDLAYAIERVNARGALRETVERAQGYGARAKDALAELPDTPHRTALNDVVDFCIARAY